MFENLADKLKSKMHEFIPYVLLLTALFLAFSVVRNVFKILKAGERIRQEREKVEELRLENEGLKEEVKLVQGQEFLEKQARDKLGLAKEGEIVLVLPEKETLKLFILETKEEKETLPDPNWKKWLKLFFSNFWP